MPFKLGVYDPADWLQPGDPAGPADRSDTAACVAFEAAQRAVYQRHLAAQAAWYVEHGYPSIEAAFVVPDESFSIESKIDYASLPEDIRDATAKRRHSPGTPLSS
jgi:hypothetical protein